MPSPNPITSVLAQAFSDIEMFSKHILKRPLRPYQVEPARAYIRSVLDRDGEEYVWRFPRQSGKNETVAHCDAMLLFLFQRVAGATIIHTAPTLKPQAVNHLNRVWELCVDNPFFRNMERRDNRIIFGRAQLVAISGMPQNKPRVGLTASLALQKDEAQDLDQAYIERAFDPMTSDTNAPQLYTGTARHDGTYLARKRKTLEARQRQDGRRRVFVINWRHVEKVNPSYGQRVRKFIAEKGLRHPTVMSEYHNVENSSTGKLFDERRIKLVFGFGLDERGQHRQEGRCVITLDVGGTSLDGETREHDPTVAACHRHTRRGHLNVFHTDDYLVMRGANILDDTPARTRLFAWIRLRKPIAIIVDATGLGVALASALQASFGAEIVVPLVLTQKSKSDMLNGFLALVESGRYTHYAPTSAKGDIDEDAARLMEQMKRCAHEYSGQHVSFGVPAGETWINPLTTTREDLHDDHLLANSYLGLIADADLIADYFPAIVTPADEKPSRRHGKY